MHGIETLKTRMRSGEIIVGTSVAISANKDEVEQLMAQRDYAFLSVDAQHNHFNEDNLPNICEISDGMGIPIVVRIKHTRFTYLIGNVLDLGPSMIEVPQVEYMSTVRDAVDNFLYPQTGCRSWGPMKGPKFNDLPDRLEYSEWWNSHGVLWMQIESVEAVTQAHAFAKSGVDCLSFGPIDLMFNLKRHPHHVFNTMDDCVAYVVKALEDTSVAVCVRSYSPDLREKYFDLGVTVLLESPVS